MLKVEARTFENQVATLSQNSTIEDIVTGKLDFVTTGTKESCLSESGQARA